MSWISNETLSTVSEIIEHKGAQNFCISRSLEKKIFFLTKQDTLLEVSSTTLHLI